MVQNLEKLDFKENSHHIPNQSLHRVYLFTNIKREAKISICFPIKHRVEYSSWKTICPQICELQFNIPWKQKTLDKIEKLQV